MNRETRISNQIYFVIYSYDDNCFGKFIYDHISLNDIDSDLVRVNLNSSKATTKTRRVRRRVEFRKVRRAHSVDKFYYAVEFNDDDADCFDDLTRTFDSLNEIYNTTYNNKTNGRPDLDDDNMHSNTMNDCDKVANGFVQPESNPSPSTNEPPVVQVKTGIDDMIGKINEEEVVEKKRKQC